MGIAYFERKLEIYKIIYFLNHFIKIIGTNKNKKKFCFKNIKRLIITIEYIAVQMYVERVQSSIIILVI